MKIVLLLTTLSLFICVLTTVQAAAPVTSPAPAPAPAQAFEAPAFDPNEKCDSRDGQIVAARTAVETSCKWISEIGLGTREDPNSAISKMNKHRFCKDNYVFAGYYIEGLTATSHQDFKMVVLHPVKPALEKVVTPHYDFGNGYKMGEQFNYAATVHPKGCWSPYLWTRPETEQKIEKITFSMKCDKDKITGKYHIVAAGIYASHDILEKLNPAACKGVENKSPYSDIK
ncbi:MAG: hypothetical protein HQK49_17850 [Oligoflexia bacterium]|nr:hypothetical protein [Oligoflexia bacterium]